VTTFKGQKNMIMVTVIQVLLQECQENLFVKSLCCKKEDEAFFSIMILLCNFHPHTHTYVQYQIKRKCM